MADIKRRGFLGLLAAAPLLPSVAVSVAKDAAVSAPAGAVTSISVTSAGTGYTTPPMYQFVGDAVIGRTMNIRLPNV